MLKLFKENWNIILMNNHKVLELKILVIKIELKIKQRYKKLIDEFVN